MSFHSNLIKTIKSENHEAIFSLLDQIIKTPQDTNLKKNHIDIFLSFLGTINDYDIIIKYYTPLITICQSNNWKHDLSSYPLLIRILCNINNVSSALEYLNEMNKYKISIKTRTIAPILENLSKNHYLEQEQEQEQDYFKTLVDIFDKYNSIFTLEQFHHLLIAFKKYSSSSYQDIIIDKIKKMFEIWCENDFIINDSIIQLILEWFPNYKLKPFEVSEDNITCSECNNQLKKHQLSFNERKTLITDILTVYSNSTSNKSNKSNKMNKMNQKNNLMIFKSIIESERNLNVINKQIYIIDGGNMGHSESGEFSPFPITNFITSMKSSNVFILLILHQSRSTSFKDYVVDPNKLMIYYTPYGENDDLYWLLAGFMIKNSLVITNDMMRDHHVDKLDEKLFKRWKDNHIATYHGVDINKPSLYTIGVQEHTSGWHIPKWFCFST